MSTNKETTGRLWRHCPLCGMDGGELHLIKGALRIVNCSACGMLFANPVEAQLIEGSYYNQIAGSFYLSADKVQSDYAPVRFEREVKLFRRFCPVGAVLDVGCSTGAFLHQLTSQYPGYYTCLGTDVAGPALDYAERKGITVCRTPFLSPEFDSRFFDAITFWAVLEHLAEPRAFLAQAFTRLKPGGYCFILVPNMRSLAVRLLGKRYRYVMPEHLNYFTSDTLKRHVGRERNFELVTLGTTHFNPVVIWQDWRAKGELVPDLERARLLKRTTAWKQHCLLWPVKVIYALLEGFLGRAGLADNLVAVLRRKE